MISKNLITAAVLATESSQMTVTDAMTEAAQDPGIIKSWISSSIPVVLNACISVILAIVVFVIGSKIIGSLVKMVKKTLDKSKIDAGVSSFLASITKYALYFLLIMVILSGFGVTTGSIVAVLGSAGLTAGLALQGSLSNFAGGVLILILRPFMVGDYIVDHSSNLEGTVSSISICYTKVLTFDNKVIMIPNGTLSNATITNISRMPERRLDLVVGISYEADIRTAKAVIAEVIDKNEKVLKEKPIDIFVNELGSSSVNIGIHIWVPSGDFWPTKWALTEDIKYALDEHDIPIPYNQLDVHLDR